MREKIKFLTLSFGIFLYANIFAQENNPRMWEAENIHHDGTKFFILGASHFGLPVEYDRYFYEKVLPSFKKSQALHYEGAGDSEPEPYPLCNDSILDEAGHIELNAFREKTLTVVMKVNNKIHKNDPSIIVDGKIIENHDFEVQKSFISSLDEFSLIQVYKSYLDNWNLMTGENSKKVNTSPDAGEIKGGVVGYFLSLNPKIEKFDLDTKYGVRRAYCMTGPKRIKYLRAMFNPEKSNDRKFVEKIPSMERAFNALLKDGDYSENSDFDDLSDMDSTLVCERTKDWTRKIELLNDKKTHFLVVGARHLNDIKSKNFTCLGLLNDLKLHGFEIKKIK